MKEALIGIPIGVVLAAIVIALQTIEKNREAREIHKIFKEIHGNLGGSSNDTREDS
jgi:hypothetical protein